jgi:hypothetical protein
VARASSVIKVSIIGDVRNLQKGLGQADAATGGFIKSSAKLVGGALLAGAAIDKVFDFAQGSLAKADDFNDHLDTLSKLTTPAFARHLHDVAFGMADIGLSAGGVAAAATAFASFGKAAGASTSAIEAAIPGLLDVAEAIHAKTGKTIDEVITDIGAGINGTGKGLRDYGISVDKALNPDERILSILSQAKTLFGDANSAASDLHGTQDKINANVDNFSIKLGEALEGPLNSIALAGLEILDELKDWPGAIADILGPLARVADAFAHILDLAGRVVGTLGSTSPVGRLPGVGIVPGPGMIGGRNSDSFINDAQRRFDQRNGAP